jgi:hypothetical protein
MRRLAAVFVLLLAGIAAACSHGATAVPSSAPVGLAAASVQAALAPGTSLAAKP